jgi:hypothetical protein
MDYQHLHGVSLLLNRPWSPNGGFRIRRHLTCSFDYHPSKVNLPTSKTDKIPLRLGLLTINTHKMPLGLLSSNTDKISNADKMS